MIEPIKEAGMQDYRLDAIERPERHPAATDRLTGRGRSSGAGRYDALIKGAGPRIATDQMLLREAGAAPAGRLS